MRCRHVLAWCLPLLVVGLLTFGLPAQPVVVPAKKGYAIIIGADKWDKEKYGGVVSPVAGVAADVKKLTQIATADFRGNRALTGESANVKNVIQQIRKALTTDDQGNPPSVKPGETLLIAFSGYGAQVPDTNDDESDGWDETWCLYDGHLLDDQLAECWAEAADGVRIVVVFDSCYSSTPVRGLVEHSAVDYFLKVRSMDNLFRYFPKLQYLIGEEERIAREQAYRSRLLPTKLLLTSYAIQEVQLKGYQDKLRDIPALRYPRLLPSIITLAASQDSQVAWEDDNGGYFTQLLGKEWDAKPNKNYRDFLNDVAGKVKVKAQDIRERQDPSYTATGPADQGLADQKPFNR